MTGTHGARTRPATRSDVGPIDAVETAAFGHEADHVIPLVHALRSTEAAVLELVAEDDDGELVGHVMLSRGWLDAPVSLVTVRVLSPLAVAPDRQRQGIGRRLIEHAVEDSEEALSPAVFLEGDPRYYAASGFAPASSRGFRSPSTRIPEPAFQVRTLTAYEPWMTGTLVYPEAFWATDTVGLRRRPLP